MRAVWIAAVVIASAAPAQAHIAMSSPRPRSAAQKAGPCGPAGSVRGTNVTTYQPGETITVTWTETVDHPGHYRIAFDDDGTDGLLDPRQPTDNYSFTLVDRIADKGGGMYTQQVTLPTTPCANCTLQLMQVMQVNAPYNSFYWQCADIVIAGEGGGGDPVDVDGGCSAGASTGPGAVLLIFAALVGRRRRRRSP